MAPGLHVPGMGGIRFFSRLSFRYTTSLVRITVPVFGSRTTANWLPGV